MEFLFGIFVLGLSCGFALGVWASYRVTLNAERRAARACIKNAAAGFLPDDPIGDWPHIAGRP